MILSEKKLGISIDVSLFIDLKIFNFIFLFFSIF